MRLKFDIDSYSKKKLRIIKILKVLMIIYVIIVMIPIINVQHRVRGILNLCTVPGVFIMMRDKIEDILTDIEKRKGNYIAFENNKLIIYYKYCDSTYEILNIFDIKAVKNKTTVKARVRDLNNPIFEYTTTINFSKYWESGMVSVLNKYRLLSN